MESAVTIDAVRIFSWMVFCCAAVLMVRRDYATKKLRNRSLALALACAAAAYIVLLLHTSLASRQGALHYLTWSYYRAVALHVALSLAAALCLWQFRLWPAGDAKLYLVLAILFPLMELPSWFDPSRLFLISLINIFVPAAIAMIVTAFITVWKLYLGHQARFLYRLGFRGALAYLHGGLEKKFDLKAAALRQIERWSAHPADLIGRWLYQLAMLLLTAVVVVRVEAVFDSTLLVSGICYLVMRGWQQLCRGRGTVAAILLSLAGTAALCKAGRPVAPASLFQGFADISLFSLSLEFGMKLTRRLLTERGLVVAPLFAVAAWLVPMLVMKLTGDHGYAATLLKWSAVGGIFGLGYVLVRIVDEHDTPHPPPEGLYPYAVLAPAFVDHIRQSDEDFFEEHLSPLYADGLTPGQLEALKGWCARNAITRVPLRRTVSFSFWIFLGFLLTTLLKGHVLQALR